MKFIGTPFVGEVDTNVTQLPAENLESERDGIVVTVCSVDPADILLVGMDEANMGDDYWDALITGGDGQTFLPWPFEDVFFKASIGTFNVKIQGYQNT